MGHKADQEFFQFKRPWSRYKDEILRYYLTPYLPKIRSIEKPVLIVDGFAGRGEFEDGAPGSPLIIAEAISAALQLPGPDVRLLCVERDVSLYKHLEASLAKYAFAEARRSTFLESIPTILDASASHSVFLYLDPYTVEGIEWDAVDRIFQALERNMSVEMLLNFNAVSFARRARAVLAPSNAVSLETELDRAEESESRPVSAATVDKLNQIIGGGWWKDISEATEDFPQYVEAISDRFCEQLSSRFSEVCVYPIAADRKHKLPVYLLIFGSRHEQALVLMNDAAARARSMEAEDALPDELLLFESRPESLVPSKTFLRDAIVAHCKGRMTRWSLYVAIVRSHFGMAKSGDIGRELSKMVKENRAAFSSPTRKLNHDAIVWLK